MQNKFFGSKLNSVLLLILIILMIIALKLINENKKSYLPMQTQYQSFQNDTKSIEIIPPVEKDKEPKTRDAIKENAKAIALKKFVNIQTYMGVPVQECTSEGQIYFEVMNSYVDGDNLLYDINGNFTGSCGGGLSYGPSNQPIIAPQCLQLTNCKIVYGQSGYNGVTSFVDVYHIKK